MQFKFKAMICVSLLSVISAHSWAEDKADLKQCAQEKVAFDGIKPLKYADLTGEANSHIPLWHDHPALCASADEATCKGKAYLIPGNTVAVANTCGDYAQVQYIGERTVSYGWVESVRLENGNIAPAILPYVHNYSAPPLELASFVGEAEKIIDWKVGDLNFDGRPDYLVVLVSKADNSQKTLIIVARQKNGSLREVGRNETTAICDLYAGQHGGFNIAAYRGSFEIQNSWGGAHANGWQRLRFDWNSGKKQWVLTKVLHGHDSDNPEERSRVTENSKEHDEITFDKFNGDNFDIQWKNRG